MADFGIWTKNADIQARAGQNANATSKATAATDVYVLDVEASINTETRFNWSDAVTAGLDADVEGLLREASACLCAIYVINDDMSGYSTLLEASTMMDVLFDRANKAISKLKDQNIRKFMESV